MTTKRTPKTVKTCPLCESGYKPIPGMTALRMPQSDVVWLDNHWHSRKDFISRELNISFSIDSDTYHVLRILANGQISANKGRELICDLLSGKNVELPPYEA